MISFFSTPEHKVFTYKPRYYDPEKERIKQAYEKKRLEAMRNGEPVPEEEVPEYVPGASLRASFENHRFEQKVSDSSRKGIHTIIMVVSLILAIVIVYLIFAKFMPLLYK